MSHPSLGYGTGVDPSSAFRSALLQALCLSSSKRLLSCFPFRGTTRPAMTIATTPLKISACFILRGGVALGPARRAPCTDIIQNERGYQ